MIPKIIHFFHHDKNFLETCGNMVCRCYASWQYHLKDYELRLWHPGLAEFQSMLEQCDFLRHVYEKKIWAVVADYVRAWALFHHGGIYLDTDIYLFQNLDHLLDNEFFSFGIPTGYAGEEMTWQAEPGFFGARGGGNFVMTEILKIYNSGEIFRLPFWLANDILALSILRAKADFSDNLIRPAYPQEYEQGLRPDFICDDLAASRTCVMKKNGITLYPRDMVIQGGVVGRVKNRWILISPPPLPGVAADDSVFCLKDTLAYHICGNSWSGEVAKMAARNLKGFKRLKFFIGYYLKNFPAIIKRKMRYKMKNI